MLKYHHLGIPTDECKPGERHIPHLKMFVSGYEDSQFNIEWMRFEPDANFPEIVKTIPHVAFEVVDLKEAISGRNIIIEPNSPSEGITVAFIEENGAPVELLQFVR